MKYFSFTTLILAAFLAYVSHSVYVIYALFNVEKCKHEKNCINPLYNLEKQKFTISVYTSLTSKREKLTKIWKKENISVLDPISIDVNVSVPRRTSQNGTLYAHIYLHLNGKDYNEDPTSSYAVAPLTKYMRKRQESFNLMSGNSNDTKTTTDDTPYTHWRPCLTFYILTDPVSFDRYSIPHDIYPLLRLSSSGQYIPVIYVDELEMLERNLKPLNSSTDEVLIKIIYSAIGIGKLRIWRSVHMSMNSMKDLGFSDKDLDEVKGIFTDTNLYLLGLTFTIAAFHMLFDFLAFKNDIIYWRKRSTMVGLSTRAVLWRCVSTAIIFLYLLDEKTSLLVLIPTGIGAIIELWKVSKALKINISWSENHRMPTIRFGEKSNEEKETEEFDSQAMKYLSYALYPLIFIGALYSLVYQPHKSWYSWLVRSLVNGVYVFGFLFMLPQLFVNYKLKSVAHLPWRALMYKAFNTFIDDVFAFIITMPTAHRLACFRDDIVFVIYLYQRWLYPVDHKRVNEYGMSYEKKEHQE